MKKIFTIVALVSLLSALAVVVSAQGPTGTYVSGISCVNLGNEGASIKIDFYDDGSVVGTINDTISAGGNVMYYTPSVPDLDDGFVGSAVVSSDQQIACSVNTQTGSGTTRVGTSNGLDAAETGPVLYAPQVLNDLGGFSSYVAVQNAGSSAVDVNAYYYNSEGTEVYSTKVNIAANSSHVFYQDEPEVLSTNFIGSAVFEADNGSTPLAGTVNFYNAGTTGNDSQFHSYNTFTSGASKVYGPRIAKNLSGQGWTSGWACQNLGSGSADIEADITFLDQGTGNTVTDSMSKNDLGEGQAWFVYLGDHLPSVDKGYGSVVMTATGGDVVCIFNEDNRSMYAGQGSTYSGIPDGEQTDTMFFPQIVSLGGDSFQGGFQFANTTSNDTTCDYTFSDGTTVPNQDLSGNGSNSVFAPSHLSDDFNGSLTVECGEPIVGIYNLTIFGGEGDPFATNNGVNQ